MQKILFFCIKKLIFAGSFGLCFFFDSATLKKRRVSF